MADGAVILNARRYYLGKRLHAARGPTPGLANVWRAIQEATAGTALAAAFPCATALAAAGYTTREDLAGATVDELVDFAGLTSREAQAVLAALAAL